MVTQYEKRKVLTMRKLLAVLLAAIMLVGVLAALPASAETTGTPGVSGFDGTTAADTPDLLITEVLVNSKTNDPTLNDQMREGDVATWFSPDAFDFIEIYNAGSEQVDLYSYSIARSKDSSFFKATSETVGQFTKVMQLGEWPLQGHPDAPGAAFNSQYDAITNPEPNDAWLMPGQFAVIWFYGTGTMELTAKKGGPVSIEDFKKHYGMPEDTIVIAVPGIASDGDSFDLAPNYTYALVKDGFNKADRVASGPWGDSPTMTDSGRENVVCMFDYILRNAVGIYSDANMDDMSAYYVPASCKPEVLNAVNWKGCVTDEEKAAYVELNDYVEAEFTHTYRSSAILSYANVPSPGTMPAWQWAYVDPIGETTTVGNVPYTHGLQALSAAAGADYDKVMKSLVTDWDDEATAALIKKDGDLDVTETNGKFAWSTNCLNALITETADAITGDGGSAEVKIDYSKNFVSRDELERRHKLKNKGTTEEDGLPIWVLILIIVGGVVLVAGIAVVVIIIIKKKNRPVAADDIAAEGEIQVVDETDAE